VHAQADGSLGGLAEGDHAFPSFPKMCFSASDAHGVIAIPILQACPDWLVGNATVDGRVARGLGQGEARMLTARALQMSCTHRDDVLSWSVPGVSQLVLYEDG
jgi:hypothetical protein